LRRVAQYTFRYFQLALISLFDSTSSRGYEGQQRRVECVRAATTGGHGFFRILIGAGQPALKARR
jgi:hypothetical protein